MRKPLTGKIFIFAVTLSLVLALTLIVFAQAPAAGQRGGRGGGAAPAAGAPAAPAAAQGGGGGRGGGAPNPLLSQPAPKMADGTVNLGRVAGEKGMWNVPYITNMLAPNVFVGAPQPAPRGEGARGAGGGGGGGGPRGGAPSEPWVPFKPWAAAVYNYNSLNESKYDPESMCVPPGGPRMFGTPYPMEIIQLPQDKRVLMIYEGATHIWREIYMDGRPHPGNRTFDGSHLWAGHSVGHYEDNGNTLVVDTVGFNEGTWLDYFGHPHSDQLHTVEKFTRPNKGTLHYEALIDDPGAYTKSFSVQWNIPWNPTGELLEYICQSNNQYLNRLKDDFGDPVALRQQ